MWFVLCTVLGARHEAEVRHVTDEAGNSVHAALMHGLHTSQQSDVHGAEGSSDTEPCLVAAAHHQAHIVTPSLVLSAWLATSAPTTTLETRPAGHGSQRIYRLAPKTSPPRA